MLIIPHVIDKGVAASVIVIFGIDIMVIETVILIILLS